MKGRVQITVLFFWILLAICCMSGGCGDDDHSSPGQAPEEEDDDEDDDDTDTVDDDDAEEDDDDDDDSSPPSYPESCPEGPVFSFDLTSIPMVVPYPNDLYRIQAPDSPSGFLVRIDGDTARPLGMLAGNPLFQFLTSAYNELTGFSTMADLYMPTGVEPDAATLPDEIDPSLEDSLFLFVDDPASVYDGEPAPLKVQWRDPDLHLTPWFPLKEKTRYALVATRGLHPKDGCYRASESMRSVWTTWATGTGKKNESRYAAILERLAAMGVQPDQVLSISDFTTGWITRDLEQAKLVLDEMAAADPSEFYDWEILPDSDPRLFAMAHAAFDVPIFKPGGRSWELDADGKPVVDHMEAVTAYFSLPDQAAHPDGQPYPILVFEHGMFNDMHEIRPPFTTEIAAQGFAMVAIDAVCHGDRLPEWMGDVGQFLCFYDVLHPTAWRDNFRESVANLLWLTHSLQTLADVDLDENGIPDFDVAHIYNLGASFGSILGGTFSALEPKIDAHVLAASGAKLTSIARDGEAAEYFDMIETIERLLAPDEPITDFLHLLLYGMLQAILDPADSANYVAHTLNDPLPSMDGHAPQVFQQGSAYDDTIGGPPGGWLCRAGGWPQIEPDVWDVGVDHVTPPFEGSAFYQYDTDEHTLIFDSHPMGMAAREQVLHFFRTHLDTGVGEIIDPMKTFGR